MLLYRPLIIDWLPVPLPHPPQQTCCLLHHPHLLCLCLLVSLSPPLSPLSRFPPYHVSFSFYIFLCLSSSVLLHFFGYFGLVCGPHDTHPLLLVKPSVFECACWIGSLLLSSQLLSFVRPLQPSASLIRVAFDVGFSCFVLWHSWRYLWKPQAWEGKFSDI